MTSKEIRSKFLEFFNSKSHTIVPSAPMVIKNDPTLMFTNAGMNQFKEFFLGNKAIKDKRIADSQKCLRVSGKHNDLEEVGMDTYHHTMFEMLGNWSFGDYFKEEAINWAWELLTDELEIDKDQLYVTIFKGDESEGLERDHEAYNFWKELVPEDRIINGNKDDNFWEMGEQGPCGPCSEIHVDIRSKKERSELPGVELVNKDHPEVVEIWNLVFIQFNRKADGSLEKLPKQHVDTGMGFERLCMILQGKQSNYDTDVFKPLINEIAAVTKSEYGKDEKTDIAIRVIADHVRAVAFSIADGQLPSNTGAGYVIRRILRRAIRYGFTFLDIKQPFIYQLIQTLSDQMGEAYPELVSERNLIENVIKEEEHSFLRTLDQGLILLEQLLTKSSSKTVSGKKAFELYDTFGFPIDLTALILRERGYDLDLAEFEEELKKQKDRSRAATKVETGDWKILYDDTEEEFIGYDSLETNVKITRYRKVENRKDGKIYQLVFNLTPFYPEGGGQVGDKGYLEATNGEVVYIIDTKKENNLILHFVKNLPKNTSDTFKVVVDKKKRSRTAANHTATHLLHRALRKVLGDHVVQKGSMVEWNYFRFDFSHFTKVTKEEQKEIADLVNQYINDEIPLDENRNVPYQQAIDEGAIALFGEKYDDTVRTIRFGESMELCGGTHVKNTKDIWYFMIESEGAIASGIRRIEAVSGFSAKEKLKNKSIILEQIRDVYNHPAYEDLFEKIEKEQIEKADFEKQIQIFKKREIQSLKTSLKNEVSNVKGINFLAKKLDLDASGMKDLSFELGGEVENLFLLFGSSQNDKAFLSCYISKELASTKNLNAGQIVKELGKFIQGAGGGQPFFATAGGKDPNGLDEALSRGKEYLL